MRARDTIFSSFLADDIRAFLAYKRALGRGFDTEERALHLMDRYLIQRRVASPGQITPGLIDAFLASRPRSSPRSYNHLLCTVRRLFDWLAAQGRWTDSPVQASPRRQAWRPAPFLFDRHSACRLLEAAAGLRDNPKAPLRGATYRTIFGLLYALGLRVGEVARLRIGDVDEDRRLLAIRKTKFCKSRWVPFGPRVSRLLEHYRQAKAARGQDTTREAPLFCFTGGRSIHPGTISQTFHGLVPRLNLHIPAGASPPPSPPSAAQLCGRHAVALVSLRPRSGRSAAPLGHLSGARRRQLHRRLPDLDRRPPAGSQSPLRGLHRPGVPGGLSIMRMRLGQIVHSFFEDYLKVRKGLRPASIRSYRDALKLYLLFVATDTRRRVTRLRLEDLTLGRTLRFLDHLEQERRNHVRTRNQRLAALRTFFEYVARRAPHLLSTCEQISLIPVKRAAPRTTYFLEREELAKLFAGLPIRGCHALRNRTLLLFLYNTGARVQEVADLRRGHLDLGAQPRVRLRGKGDKWRTSPLWAKTADQLRLLLQRQPTPHHPEDPVFVSRPGRPLTRFGIYKIVRRCAGHLDSTGMEPRRISPHLFRHTAAVHLLESGVEINVIRGWLGHVQLETTHRYAQITVRIKEAALRLCEPPLEVSPALPRKAVWKDDEALLAWLDSL